MLACKILAFTIEQKCCCTFQMQLLFCFCFRHCSRQNRVVAMAKVAMTAGDAPSHQYLEGFFFSPSRMLTYLLG